MKLARFWITLAVIMRHRLILSSGYSSVRLNRLGDILFNLDTFRLEPTHVDPAKPRDGDIRYADGTNWNPGSGGEGIYAYFNNTWNKLS